MTPEKILEVSAQYRNYFVAGKVEKKEAPRDKHSLIRAERLSHCHYMTDKIDEFVKAGRIEKAFRWLGFIQGTLFACGIHSIIELADHNSLPLESTST